MSKYLLIIILLFSFVLSADILHVPEDYRYISLAILASADGDTVLVEPGNYSGVIDYSGKAITLTSNYIFSENEADIHHTVLSGNYSDQALVKFVTAEDSSSILNGFTITNNGEPDQGGAIFCDGTSPLLSNLRLIDNQASSGGALYANLAQPQMHNCNVSFNAASEFGGAIYLEESLLTMTGSTLEENLCDGGANLGRGGALFVSNSQIDMTDCHFYNNNANVHAGAVYLSYAVADINRCSFIGNTGGGNVGGIYFYNSDHLNIINCTFTGNSGTDGGALRFYNGTGLTDTPFLLNTVCWDNEPVEIFFSADDQTNELAVAYCDIEGGEEGLVTNDNADVTWLEGNIDADPLFISPEYNHFYLMEDSPCLDAGTDYFEYAGNVFEITSYYDENVDIGAFETEMNDPQPLAMFEVDVTSGEEPLTVNFTDLSLGNITGWNWDFDNDGSIDSNEQNPDYTYATYGLYTVCLTVSTEGHSSTAQEIDLIEVIEVSEAGEELSQIISLETYPNPFNPELNISFFLKESSPVILEVYNVKGERIDTIEKGIMDSGWNYCRWQAKNTSSGMYFLRIQTAKEGIYTRKVVLIK